MKLWLYGAHVALVWICFGVVLFADVSDIPLLMLQVLILLQLQDSDME